MAEITVVLTAAAELLPSLLSAMVLERSTTAVPLVSVPALVGVTTTVRVALLPILMLPLVNWATPAVVPIYVNPLETPGLPTTVKPVGKVKSTVTPVALAVPVLETVRV